MGSHVIMRAHPHRSLLRRNFGGRAAGEFALLPTVRAAAADKLIVAHRFSCREQIEQGTAHGMLRIARTVRN